jgi:hypothetical protein
VCGRRLFCEKHDVPLRKKLTAISKRVGTHHGPGPVEMQFTIKVSRQKDDDDAAVSKTYFTGTVDLLALTTEGRKIFESFHIITVPDGQFDSYVALRRQLRQSLRADLRKLIESLASYN